MNLMFATEGEGWPGYPARSFARLERTEPIVQDGASEVLLSLDAVDAGWSGFGESGPLDLREPKRARQWHTAFWRDRFAGKSPAGPDYYDEMPVFKIEVTLKPGQPWYGELAALGEEDWVVVVLDENYAAGPEVEVYGGLLATPVISHLVKIDKNVPGRETLDVVFSMETWPDATEAEIRDRLGSLNYLGYLIGLDVGQGCAIGLADSTACIQLYFDLGGGVRRNAPTRPNPLRFCWMVNAPIVLSHWDEDHWSGETTDPGAAGRVWIAPRQSVTTAHVLFVSKILAAGAKLLIWGKTPASISIAIAGGQTLDLSRCTGKTRNGSGIAAIVQDSKLGKEWLLTGDAGYNEIRSLPAAPSVIVVPHHGADMGSKSVAPSNPGGYVRLIYSFGPGNKHGRTHVQHPTASAVSVHSAWNHGAWTGGTPGGSVAGGDVLATAEHPSNHLAGVAIGWTAPPAVPLGPFPHATPGAA
jgi:hypothetical protein